MISCSSTGVISSISLFSSQASRYSLKTFMSYKVFFFVFSFSSFSVNSLTSKSLMDANLPLPLTGEVLISSANSSDLIRLVWMWARAVFGKGGNVHFLMSGFFNPFAKSHLNQKLDTAFSSNENHKKRHYNQRIIEVEHGSFSPIVFSPYGGNGREAERSLTELAQKKQMGYSIVIHWLRVKLYFNLLRSAVLCLRGSRTTKHELNTDFSKAEIANCDCKDKVDTFEALLWTFFSLFFFTQA